MAKKVQGMSVFRGSVLALGASVVLCGVALAQGSVQLATDQPIIRNIERPDMPGRAIYTRQCAPCHGTGPGDDGAPMLPGTAALTAKYAGRLPGLLELRSDLTEPVLSLFVRRGTGAMPMFRKAELSDADIAAIAEYLAAAARVNIPDKR